MPLDKAGIEAGCEAVPPPCTFLGGQSGLPVPAPLVLPLAPAGKEGGRERCCSCPAELGLSAGRCRSLSECSAPQNKPVPGWRGSEGPGCRCCGSGGGMLMGCSEGKHLFLEVLS